MFRLILALCALFLTCCEIRNPTLRWWKEHTLPLTQSRSTETDVLRVLGKPESTLTRDQAMKYIHQFNSDITTPELDALNWDSSFFYAIDPDNTLIVCFDGTSKAVKAYFGGQ